MFCCVFFQFSFIVKVFFFAGEVGALTGLNFFMINISIPKQMNQSQQN